MRYFHMRRLLWIPLALSQCAPVPSPPQDTGRSALTPSNRQESAIPVPDVVLSPPTSTVNSRARFSSRRMAAIQFDGVAFDSRSHRLLIADQAAGPGSSYANAAAAAKSRGAIAAINGGFFDPDGKPLGKLVSEGKASGFWNATTSLCSGTFYEDRNGRMALQSRQATEWPGSVPYQELLQTGPMLIRGGKKVGGLNRDKQASRSLLIWDGANQWWMGRTSECGLQQLAEALAIDSPAGWKAAYALNLDGGSSSELWVSTRVDGGPHHSSHWWLKPARNYLILKPRQVTPRKSP